MIVLVCGGRDFTRQDVADTWLDYMHDRIPITKIVHGAARGADTLGGVWARKNNVVEAPYPANWSRDGRAAGPIRNQQMLDSENITVVLALPGGRGTADMIRRAKAKGLPVVEVIEPAR